MKQTDKLNLLTRAAKRVGLLTDGWHRDGGLAVWSGHRWVNWDPLELDHAAMWLAGRLNLPFFHIPQRPGLKDPSGPGPMLIGELVPGRMREYIVKAAAASEFTQDSHGAAA